MQRGAGLHTPALARRDKAKHVPIFKGPAKSRKSFTVKDLDTVKKIDSWGRRSRTLPLCEARHRIPLVGGTKKGGKHVARHPDRTALPLAHGQIGVPSLAAPELPDIPQVLVEPGFVTVAVQLVPPVKSTTLPAEPL